MFPKERGTKGTERRDAGKDPHQMGSGLRLGQGRKRQPSICPSSPSSEGWGLQGAWGHTVPALGKWMRCRVWGAGGSIHPSVSAAFMASSFVRTDVRSPGPHQTSSHVLGRSRPSPGLCSPGGCQHPRGRTGPRLPPPPFPACSGSAGPPRLDVGDTRHLLLGVGAPGLMDPRDGHSRLHSV